MLHSVGMTLAQELQDRGLVQESSADLESIFSQERTVYIGTDPTADSLHVGHLAWIVLMKRLGDAGHKLILLVGGGTGMIGDPKEKGERTLLAEDIIDKNARALRDQLSRLVGEGVTMVDNAEWLRQVRLLEFLRDIGKHFTVNDLVKRDLIKRRLETPDESISYTEFTYALLQAYDFRELNQRYGCDLQIGASDQWTNILSGVDLIRKKDGKEVFALAIPLVTDSTGRKFGKSEGNAVWLDGKRTSPYQFYQFWFNVDDAKAGDYLKIYTELPLAEIGAIMQQQQADPAARLAQKRLAEEVTRFVHGAEAPEQVARVSAMLFGDEPIDETLLRDYAPTYEGASGQPLVEVLVGSGLAKSKREAREFIESGAVSFGGEKVTEVEVAASVNGPTILKRGKRNAVVLI